MSRSRPGIGVVLVLSLVFVLSASRRIGRRHGTGEIFGKVTDGTDAVLPGATVTISGAALIQPMTVIAAESGGYRFPSVPIGTYTVSLRAPGFSKVRARGHHRPGGPQRRDQHQAEPVDGRGDGHHHRRESGRRHQVNHARHQLRQGAARGDSDGARSVGDHRADARPGDGREQRRRPQLGPDGQLQRLRQRLATSSGAWTARRSPTWPRTQRPTYYDFEMFEEIQITTGGMDASQESGRRVGEHDHQERQQSAARDRAAVYDVDKAFQSTNAPRRGRRAGRRRRQSAQEQHRIRHRGRRADQEGQGVVLGIGQQPEGQHRHPRLPEGRARPPGRPTIDDLNDDITEINNQSAKLQYQWSQAHKSTFLFQRSDKVRNARGANSTTALESTSRQTGPTEYFNYNHQWVVTDRLMLSGQGLFNGGGFLLDFHTDDLATRAAAQSRDARRLAIRARSATTIGPRTRRASTATTTCPSFLRRRSLDQVRPALSHRRRYKTITKTGGGATVRIRNNGDQRGQHHARRLHARDTWQWSLYFTDSWKMGRATVNCGRALGSPGRQGARRRRSTANPHPPGSAAGRGLQRRRRRRRLQRHRAAPGLHLRLFGTRRDGASRPASAATTAPALAISTRLSPTGPDDAVVLLERSERRPVRPAQRDRLRARLPRGAERQLRSRQSVVGDARPAKVDSEPQERHHRRVHRRHRSRADVELRRRRQLHLPAVPRLPGRRSATA